MAKARLASPRKRRWKFVSPWGRLRNNQNDNAASAREKSWQQYVLANHKSIKV